MNDIELYMYEAISEAEQSLREGNHGFGAVIVKDGQILARCHDMEESEADPTSHAEMNAIRLAAKSIGRDFAGCVLVSTHEPCPMCATAVAWSGIGHVAYGYSISDSIKQGRNRIDLTCAELFSRAGKNIRIDEGVLHERCSILYRQDVRAEIKRLRNYTGEKLEFFNSDSINRRIEWFRENRKRFDFISDDPLDSAYKLLLCRFNVGSTEMPVMERTPDRIMFHSKNFCPTLEACRILGYDTRNICGHYNEKSTDVLVKQVDPRLRFARNYERLRPHSDYCEEMIILERKE